MSSVRLSVCLSVRLSVTLVDHDQTGWKSWKLTAQTIPTISLIHLAVVASQKCKLEQNSAKIWTYSSSRLSKVIDFGTNRKRIICLPSNLCPILHRFWLKIAYFSYPSLIWGPRSLCSLWNFAVKLTTGKLESCGLATLWWKLHDAMIPTSTVFDWSTRMTDRRTDGDSICAL